MTHQTTPTATPTAALVAAQAAALVAASTAAPAPVLVAASTPAPAASTPTPAASTPALVAASTATPAVSRPQPMCTNAKAEKAAPVTSSTTTHDPGAHAKLPPVPDLDNRRFCRACQAVLPVEAFPLGKRRYLCRRHMWLRVKKPSKERARADPHRKLLSVLWKRCWNDAKTTFGHARIALLQRDIAKVLSGFDSGKGVHSKPPTIKSKTGAAEPAIALLPVNPSQLLSQENHVVVEIDARRDMLRAYREGGMEQYVEELGRLD